MAQMLLHNILISNACTEFRVTSKDSSVIVGRSQEFNIDIESHLVVEPSGYPHTAIPKPECILHSAMQWNNKYTITYLDALDLPIAVDGLNDAGLSADSLLFPGFAQFQEVPRKKMWHGSVLFAVPVMDFRKLRDCTGNKKGSEEGFLSPGVGGNTPNQRESLRTTLLDQ